MVPTTLLVCGQCRGRTGRLPRRYRSLRTHSRRVGILQHLRYEQGFNTQRKRIRRPPRHTSMSWFLISWRNTSVGVHISRTRTLQRQNVSALVALDSTRQRMRCNKRKAPPPTPGKMGTLAHGKQNQGVLLTGDGGTTCIQTEFWNCVGNVTGDGGSECGEQPFGNDRPFE